MAYYKYKFEDQDEDVILGNCQVVNQLPKNINWDCIVYKNNGMNSSPDLQGQVTIYCDYTNDDVYVVTQQSLPVGSDLTIFAMQLY